MNIKKIWCCLGTLVLIIGLIGCGNQPANTQPSAPKAQSSHTTVQTPAASQRTANGGKVMETLDTSNYTYIRLDDGSGKEIWAAVPRTPLEIGEEIALQNGTIMHNFNSKSLNRTFESIIFASGISRGSEGKTVPMAGDVKGNSSAVVPSAGVAQGIASQPSGGSTGAIVPFAALKVEKSTAENGYTVGELFSKAASLNKKKVTVKGQVVKISPNIMGKNWIHIQDGTGDPAKNSHDLVVTSSVMVEKGAIVSLEGVLAADKDFGGGYRYDVVIENAIIAN